MFKRIFDYIFYACYKWDVDVIKAPVPIMSSSLSVALLQFANVYTIILFVLLWFKGNSIDYPKWLHMFIGIIIGVANWCYFASKDHYKSILAKFERLSKKQRNNLRIISWLYIIITVTTAMITTWHLSEVNTEYKENHPTFNIVPRDMSL